MLILLSCAKTMTKSSNIKVPFTTSPQFIDNAKELAIYLSQYSVDELEQMLHINSKIAVENYERFQNFHNTQGLAALLSYTGIVFKKLNPKDFTEQDFTYAQDHLRLTSFLYGLLRPLDMINNYRLEGDIRLPELGDVTLFNYWKSRLTDLFIEDLQKQGGILCNLASDEMKGLFNWNTLTKKVKVITPQFKVNKDGKVKTIVIYTKMCRGEMARYILKNQITDPEMLKAFTWEGFEYNEELSKHNNLVFTN